MTAPYSFVNDQLAERRERVYLVLCGIFIGSMAMLNIIGITKFIHIGPFALAVGVLPYPLTFLCTDIICELYGKKRANFLVLTGLLVNLLVIFTLWLGHQLPGLNEAARPDWLPVGSWTPPPWQTVDLTKPMFLPSGSEVTGQIPVFGIIYACSTSSVLASMLAYLVAQFVDVGLFHFWKDLTKGKHLWLRNNGSTLVSQLVDSVLVILVTFGAAFFRGDMTFKSLLVLIGSSYLFKAAFALADTLPFYIAIHYLSRWLQIDVMAEHRVDLGIDDPAANR